MPPAVPCIDGPPQARGWTTLGEEKVPGSGDPVVHAAGGLRELVVDVHAARIAGLLDEMAALLQRKRTSPGSEGRKARVTYRYTTRRTRFWPRTPTEGGEERSVKRQNSWILGPDSPGWRRVLDEEPKSLSRVCPTFERA